MRLLRLRLAMTKGRLAMTGRRFLPPVRARLAKGGATLGMTKGGRNDDKDLYIVFIIQNLLTARIKELYTTAS